MSEELFEKALSYGRPPNIVKKFPNSKALIVSGKVIDRVMREKGQAMTIAANARNHTIIRGVLKAAQKADAAIIIEIARSECNYCATNYYNIARQVDAVCNELEITIPVAIHADHYGIKSGDDLPYARMEIPSLFEAGITSIAVDASHMMDDLNLLANIELAEFIPSWAGYETEVGEIKGNQGLSTVDDASFLIKGLNAHGIYADWIALNNGTAHGIEASSKGIQVELTGEIHKALEPYNMSGAQHGTSGNNSDKLREIVTKTNTTKANVATALQMVSWGVEVNDYGNAILGADGNPQKVVGQGVTEDLWQKMIEYAAEKNWTGGNYKNLNIVFEKEIMAQPAEIRKRMEDGVASFVYTLLNDVCNASGTGTMAQELIVAKQSYDMGAKANCIEDITQWSEDLIHSRALELDVDHGPEGDFED